MSALQTIKRWHRERVVPLPVWVDRILFVAVWILMLWTWL